MSPKLHAYVDLNRVMQSSGQHHPLDSNEVLSNPLVAIKYAEVKRTDEKNLSQFHISAKW